MTNQTLKDIDRAFKALEERDELLDKIRAEIKELDFFYDSGFFSSNIDAMFKCNDVLRIIDKYREEQE